MSKAIETVSKKVGDKEKRFYDTLGDVFVGAAVEGKSGFINMMRIKSSYFRCVLSKLKEDVANELEEFPKFREELFDKLHSFFRRYFSESGSIHFAFTPLQENVWERVYTDEDTALFRKTRSLYYVKSDRIWRSMNVDINDFTFFFDASEIELRKAYEKRKIIYEFSKVGEDGTIYFKVLHSERGRKTKIDDILREIKKKKVTEETIEKAFSIFEKQNEVDYFINKDANSFLKEQFDIWLRHYLMDEESVFSERRLKQLKALKNIAFKIVDFISQFEDELRKVWEKPKFVLNSNYVITLDKVKELCGEDFLETQVTHVLKSAEQMQEWKELLGVEVGSKADLVEKQILHGKEWKKLPIDTKNFDEKFKWTLIGKICENHELDKVLDGWLIKSENWQALNTILPKFQRKIKTIYIDPPFNKEQDADYFYHVKYKDSTWITMLENRLDLAKEILKKDGSIFVRCDYNGNMYVRLLMDEIFGSENFRNEILVSRTKAKQVVERQFAQRTDSIFLYSKTDEFSPFSIERPIKEPKWYSLLHFPREDKRPRIIFGKKYYPPKGRRWGLSQDRINAFIEKGKCRLNKELEYTDCLGNVIREVPELLYDSELVGNEWLDIPGYAQGHHFPTENSEELLKRIIESSSEEDDLVMDFFLGIGTTTAVAHKLGRKWIGVEMGEHFHSFQPEGGKISGIVVRMKEVLAGRGNHEPYGISKEVNWQGGGFFKYYELEQFEQALDKAVYKDSHPLVDWNSQNIYTRYVFLKDEKMLRALEIDYADKTVEVDLSKLHANIDVAETLSNLKGKWIMNLARNKVEFEDGEVLDLANLDWKSVRSLIWW